MATMRDADTALPTAAIHAAAERPMKRLTGPPKPSISRLLAVTGAEAEHVQHALGLDSKSWHNVVLNKVPAIERWAPVLAKCTLLSRRGLLQLLTKRSPEAPPVYPSPGKKSPSPKPSSSAATVNSDTHTMVTIESAAAAATASALAAAPEQEQPAQEEEDEEEGKLPSVGRTVYESLKRRGEDCVAMCREALTKGWVGWERWRLTEAQVDAFFAGVCDEAEQVADFLLKLGQATDPTNLFALFGR